LHAIILAGGWGMRLRPLTENRPKALVAMGERSIVEVLVEQLTNCGFRRITLCIGHLGDMIVQAIGDGSRFGVTVDYSRDPRPLGTAGPLRLVHDWTAPSLVMNCDILAAADLGALYRAHVDAGAVLTVGVTASPVQFELAVLEVADDGAVRGIWEKPHLTLDAAAGIYVLGPEAREYLPADRATDMPTLIADLVETGRQVRAHAITGPWYDIGTPESYDAAREAFLAAPHLFLGALAPGADAGLRTAPPAPPDYRGGEVRVALPSTASRSWAATGGGVRARWG
jgi:NDP-mannose synthase